MPYVSSKSNSEPSPSVGGREGRRHTLLIPFLIVVVTLIISDAREAAEMQKRKLETMKQSQLTVEVLDRSSKQVEAMKSLRNDLEALAATDPTAHKIVAEYFPAKSPASPGP